MAYDAQHALEHADAAGWALGALDPADAQAFKDHFRTCNHCQEAAAEFEPVAQGLRRAAPAVEPPEYLEAKTIAAVQQVVKSSRQANVQPDKANRWWHLHWPNPLLPVATALAAAAVTAAAFVSVQVFQLTAPAVAATINLRAQPGFSGSAIAAARHTSGGWKIQLTVEHLSTLPPGQFYECWYAGPHKSCSGPSGTHHGRHLRRGPQRQRNLLHVERSGPGQVQDHANHHRAARRRQPAWQDHSPRHCPHLSNDSPGLRASQATLASPELR